MDDVVCFFCCKHDQSRIQTLIATPTPVFLLFRSITCVDRSLLPHSLTALLFPLLLIAFSSLSHGWSLFVPGTSVFIHSYYIIKHRHLLVSCSRLHFFHLSQSGQNPSGSKNRVSLFSCVVEMTRLTPRGDTKESGSLMTMSLTMEQNH